MSGESMSFPATPAGFIESYSFRDKEQVYTNGAELISVYRVNEMIEHYFQKVHGRWEVVQVWKDNPQTTLKCSICKVHQPIYEHDEWPYCPFCGAKMDGRRD